MDTRQLNRASTVGLVALSLIALLDVVVLGYLWPRPTTGDEGTGAHIFQLSILVLAPIGLLFLATADWTRPAQIARRLAAPAVLTMLAFVALYYLEHS